MKPKVRGDIDGCRAAHARLMETLERRDRRGGPAAVAACPGGPSGTCWPIWPATPTATSAASRGRSRRGGRPVPRRSGGAGVGHRGRCVTAGGGAGGRRALVPRPPSMRPGSRCRRRRGAATRRAVSGALLPLEMLPFSRWREVEIHHVDLGLGFGYQDWSEGFVAEELPRALDTVPRRLPEPRRGASCAPGFWSGRSSPGPLELEPWE